MKITGISFFKVASAIDTEQPTEEEAQVWALNVYPE